MRSGKLNKRERATILKAQEILNEWIDYQEERGVDADNDLAVDRACVAVVGMADFMSYYEEGDCE